MVLFTLNAFATSTDTTPPPQPPPPAPLDFGPLLNGIAEFFTSLPNAIVGAFTGFISSLLVGFVNPLLGIVKTFLLPAVDVFKYSSYWFLIVGIISSFYVLLFFLTGAKFLMGSYDAEQRASAKEWLKHTLIILAIVNTSLLWYSLIVALSSGVTQALWNNGLESILNVDLNPLNIIWLIFLALSIIPAVISLYFRQAIIIMGIMLFPIAIFFYFIEPLRSYGMLLLNLIGIALLMPIMDVILLIAINLVAEEFAGIAIIGLLSTAIGLVLMTLLNIGMFYFAVFKSAATVTTKVKNFIQVFRSGQ